MPFRGLLSILEHSVDFCLYLFTIHSCYFRPKATQLYVEMFIATFDVLNAIDFGGSLCTQSGENIRAAGSNIRNIDACPGEGSWPANDTTMHILLFAETAGNLAQA